jgi:hypothetical protein
VVPGLRAARPAGFRRPRQRARPGKWLGMVQELRENGLGAYSRRGDGRRSGTAGADGGGCGRNHIGELAARAEQQAHGEATRDPREGKIKTHWRCKQPEGRVHCEHR